MMSVCKNKIRFLVIFLIIVCLPCLNLTQALEFNEEAQIGDMFGLPKDAVTVKNVNLIRETGGITVTFKENGFFRTKDYFYRNIKVGGKIKFGSQAIPLEADFVSLIDKYKFPNIGEIETKNETHVIFKKDALKIFTAIEEKAYLVKEKLTDQQCKDLIGTSWKEGYTCWNLLMEDGKISTRFEDKTEEELRQSGKLVEKNGQLFYVKKRTAAREIILNFENTEEFVKVVTLSNGVYISKNKFRGSMFYVDEIFLKNATITKEREGWFLEKGEAQYKEIALQGKALILTNKDVNTEQINKSWIKINSNIIEARATNNSNDSFTFMPLYENQLFDVYEGRLLVTLEKGDYIKMVSRKPDLVPLINHIGATDGKTIIANGIFTFTLEKRNIQITQRPTIEFQTTLVEIMKVDGIPIHQRMYADILKSVPFELFSNNLPGKKLIVGSGNNYVIVSADDVARLIINPYGIPVTNERSYNLLQTVDQLNEKWKTKGITFKAGYNTYDIDPGVIQLVNYWLEQNPDVKLDKIMFVEDLNAFAAEMSTLTKNEIIMGVGAYIMDPYSIQKVLGGYEIRPIEPLRVLDHEYQHAQEFYLKRTEYQKLKDKAWKEAEKLVKPEEYVKPKIELYKEAAEQLGNDIKIINRYLEEKNYLNLKRQINFYYTAHWSKSSELPLEFAEKYKLPSDLSYVGWWELSDEAVKELAGLALKRLEEAKQSNERYYNFYTRKWNEDREKFLKEYEGELLLEKKIAIAKKAEEISARLIKEDMKKKENKYISVVLNKLGDESLTLLKNDPSYKRRIKEISELLEEQRLKEPPESDKRKIIEEALNIINIDTAPHKIHYTLIGLIKELENMQLAKESLLLQKDIEKYIPTAYSTRKYSSAETPEGTYEELLTTLIELPKEERIARANFYSNYKKFEQILFDMDSKFANPELYQQIFGPCARKDCLDRRCLIYKGECCKKYPNSPNC